ncbi:glutamate-5-semialdehyde dehydrogenase [Thermodesulfobacteriota bacterium]
MGIKEEVLEIAKAAKEAASPLSKMDASSKNAILIEMAKEIVANSAYLVTENEKDLIAAREKGLSGAMVDRLALTDARIKSMASGLEEVAALPDPVGEVSKMYKRPNGITVGRMRIPLGVIGIIYESRPNVTADAAGLCLKSGNAVVLRGGSEAINSNMAIGKILKKVLEKHGVNAAAISIIPTTDREAVAEMLSLEEQIDVIIPRGGEGLIRYVVQNSKIPVIKHYKGVCHVFVDESADLQMTKDITINGKVQRPGVCNAVETLLFHKNLPDDFIVNTLIALGDMGVEFFADDRIKGLYPKCGVATEDDYHAEYLDLRLAVKSVDSIDDAMEHIRKYGSDHTETIITSDYNNSQKFLKEVNSSVVMVNASTRFSDGGQLGLGAEIGISTTKLHAYGPMGLESLTTEKFIVYGEGQIRE